MERLRVGHSGAINMMNLSVLAQRLIKRVVRDDSDCWVWQGSKLPSGYGLISVKSKYRLAHRVSYDLFKGDLIPKLVICHKCDNPSCINPKHLFQATQSKNILDAVEKGRYRNQMMVRTHCKNGHCFSGPDIKIHKSGWRECMICSRNYKRKYQNKINQRRKNGNDN